MFGALDAGSSVSDLRLAGVYITDSNNAGALSGTVKDTRVTNVLAVNIANDDLAVITGGGSVGGLIGSASESAIEKCAAALVVNSTGGDAGGLIGTAESCAVSACYAGGHTVDGGYDADPYNISGVAAGGLVGSAAGTSISHSYSTCSVSGTTAGGFVGTADSADISCCYATGLVNGSGAAGAFAGALSGSAADCHYYMLVNEIPPDKANGETEFGYLPPVPGAGPDTQGIKPLDLDAAEFTGFVGGERKPARPYDPALLGYYRGKYALPTVEQLGAGIGSTDFVSAHYGDWPAPETWVINQ